MTKLARRVAAELQAAGWQLERVLTDNGDEFGRRQFAVPLPDGSKHTQIRAGRPQTNGHVERLHRPVADGRRAEGRRARRAVSLDRVPRAVLGPSGFSVDPLATLTPRARARPRCGTT